MLPEFPQFKAVALSDRIDIGRHTSRYLPFSDFNFSCLWTWDVDNRVHVSELHNNLVVKFSDHASGEDFYSFLGCSNVNRTAAALIELSRRESLVPSLQLVPDVAATQLDADIFAVVEDADHADYILSAEKLCGYEGPNFASKRNEVRKFLRHAHDVRFGALNLDDPRIAGQCHMLFRWWSDRKSQEGQRQTELEFKAFDRFLKNRPYGEFISVGVFVGGKLVAFSISEIVNERCAFTHFEKADNVGVPGIGAFLNQRVATLLASRGIRFINIDRDLGVPGLRMNKRSYSPCRYLRKYTVCYR